MDNTVRSWDISTGKCKQIYKGESGITTGICMSPDGKLFFNASQYRGAECWDVQTGLCLKTFHNNNGVIGDVYMGLNEKLLFTGGYDNTAKCWNISNGSCIQTFEGHTDTVISICLDPAGRFLYTGSWDGTARCWDVQTGRCVKIFKGHIANINCIFLSPDEKFLLTGSDDGTIRIWDVNKGKENLATCHNLDKGFLWETPPDEYAKNGWFWTDREELINVVQYDNKGNFIKVLEENDEERKKYIRIFNNQKMVMTRIHDYEKYKILLKEYLQQKHESEFKQLKHTITNKQLNK